MKFTGRFFWFLLAMGSALFVRYTLVDHVSEDAKFIASFILIGVGLLIVSREDRA